MPNQQQEHDDNPTDNVRLVAAYERCENLGLSTEGDVDELETRANAHTSVRYQLDRECDRVDKVSPTPTDLVLVD